MPADPHFDRLLAFFQYGGKFSLSWLDSAPAANFLPAVRVEAAASNLFNDEPVAADGLIPVPDPDSPRGLRLAPWQLLAACYVLAMEAAEAAELGLGDEPGRKEGRGEGADDKGFGFEDVVNPDLAEVAVDKVPDAPTRDEIRESRARVAATVAHLRSGGVIEVAAGEPLEGSPFPFVSVRAAGAPFNGGRPRVALLDPRAWEDEDHAEELMRAVVRAIQGDAADGQN